MLAPTDTLTVDTSMIASWRSDTAYDYNRELMQSDFNLMDWLLEQIGRFFDSVCNFLLFSKVFVEQIDVICLLRNCDFKLNYINTIFICDFV